MPFGGNMRTSSDSRLREPTAKRSLFLPGDPIAAGLFTSESDNMGRDYAWTDLTEFGSDTRDHVVAEIGGLGANVIFAAYYGDFSEFLS
jgi:hypothetical protein